MRAHVTLNQSPIENNPIRVLRINLRWMAKLRALGTTLGETRRTIGKLRWTIR